MSVWIDIFLSFTLKAEGMEEFRYAYRPVREVKRCIRIEMLYVTSGDIYYLRLILLNRKARSDRDVLTCSGKDLMLACHLGRQVFLS